MDKLLFSVKTLTVKDGHALRSIQPDASGVYRNVPIMVLGIASRNNAYYDEASLSKHITDPSSRFCRLVQEGHMEGEWFHPITAGLDNKAVVERIKKIDRTLVSHYICGIDHRSIENNNILITADIVPCGPYGKYLRESFEDDKRNTGFSLRSLVQPIRTRDGKTVRRVLNLITFDGIDGPGFEQASKRYMTTNIGNEGFSNDIEVAVPMDTDMAAQEIGEMLGLEGCNINMLEDILGSDKISFNGEYLGVFDPVTGAISGNEQTESAFHTFMKRR